MLAFAFAYFHSHSCHRASKVFFQKCSLSLSHSLLYILTRIIEHRKPPREPCHPRGLDLPLIQNGRAYLTTTLMIEIILSLFCFYIACISFVNIFSVVSISFLRLTLICDFDNNRFFFVNSVILLIIIDFHILFIVFNKAIDL